MDAMTMDDSAVLDPPDPGDDEPGDPLPDLTRDQRRQLRDLEHDLTAAAIFLVRKADAAKEAKADHDAARKKVLDYLHVCMNPPQPPPPLPLFDVAQAEADRQAMTTANERTDDDDDDDRRRLLDPTG